ncbi:MAG: SpoIIE family protein phosphatase [Actinomycetota bacterium]|nr:SpoIIE family protein phosphatase [Actinomycetota bacterium]
MDASDQQTGDTDILSRARAALRERAAELGRDDVADDGVLVLSELVSNAVLHGGGCTGIAITGIDGGLRIEVRDGSRVPPMLGRPSAESLTGRGLRLVASLAARWGAETEAGGKVVWAEMAGGHGSTAFDLDEDDLLAMWGDDWEGPIEGPQRFHVELGDVPTDLLLAAKSHVDDVVREFTLAAAGAEAGLTGEVPDHLRSLLTAVVERFAEARMAIKRQALDAARRGDETTRLELDLPASAADAGLEYLAALDEVDAYCRARRLLTLETPPPHHAFRHWYVEELVKQIRAASAGQPPPRPQSFARHLLDELSRAVTARQMSERAARVYSVVSALASAATPEAVADAVLHEGVAALGAAGGGLLLATDADRLLRPGAVGYDESVVARLRNESRHAELPAAVALRTGVPVWLESQTERDVRFPALAGLEATTVALCAVPLEVQGRRLGALRFSFSEPRLFDEDERRLVLALASQTAQALDRAELQRDRVDVSRRLQRSLLPPTVPRIAGLEVAAIYHPFGNGIDVGGDFYDIWPVGERQWAIAIGDAAGTGPEAAVLAAGVRHTLRALTVSERDPGLVMRTLNRALIEAAPETTGEQFCTAIFAVVTTDDGVDVRLATGGHPEPIVRRADGRIEVVPLAGTLLGVLPDAGVGTAAVRLDVGDTLVLLTDGILEAHGDGPPFELDGVMGVLAPEPDSAHALAAALETAVLGHVGGSLTDDVAAVVLRVPRDPTRRL